MILSIASGKGGTGKTTLSTALALALGSAKLLDCDVEEPNAHLFLDPDVRHEQRVEVPAPRFIEERCTACNKCVEFCEYNALALVKDKVLIFRNLCHNCGGCTIICPEDALPVTMEVIGHVYKAIGLGGVDLVWGEMLAQQVMGSQIIAEVKRNIDPGGLNIIDCPPGTTHPMVKAVSGSDYSLIVTEPTPFGLNDLKITLDTLKKINIPCGIIINRSDMGKRDLIEDYAGEKGIPILMTIPYSREIAAAYSRGVITLPKDPQWVEEARAMMRTIEEIVSHTA